jgi:hypothetical protein
VVTVNHLYGLLEENKVKEKRVCSSKEPQGNTHDINWSEF